MDAQLTFVHALSPLHAGIGQGAGVIDLPIAREKATGLPFLPGSSLKGSLRARCEDKEQARKIFGSEASDIATADSASLVQISDQRLLLLPIRSLVGTFAWVTSPYILHRFVRDMLDTKVEPPQAKIPDVQPEHCCIVENDTKITIDATSPRVVYLEDLDLTVQSDQETSITAWANWLSSKIFPEAGETIWQQMLRERLCIVHDDIFNFFIDTATEITARIKLLEDSKTVKDGGLWYEEALPTETILSGLVVAPPAKSEEVFKVLNTLKGKTLQLGGKATVGRGLCRVQLVEGGK